MHGQAPPWMPPLRLARCQALRAGYAARAATIAAHNTAALGALNAWRRATQAAIMAAATPEELDAVELTPP